MADHFRKLTIKDFRGFRSLELDGLKSLNLIVGRNNVGKTSLLEAIVLAGFPEYSRNMPIALRETIGKEASQRYFPWLIRDGVDEAIMTASFTSGFREGRMRRDEPFLIEKMAPLGTAPTRLDAHVAGPSIQLVWRSSGVVPNRVAITQQVAVEDAPRTLSNALELAGAEELIQRTVRSLDPRVERVRLITPADGNQIVVDTGLSKLIPITQVGDGVLRVVTILSDLLAQRAPIGVVDEIENGIHHTALRDIFTGLAEASDLAGVQLFITTHSYEAIEAAHEAMSARKEYDLAIVQLFRVDDGPQGRVLQSEEIEAALASGLDLRQ